MSVTPSNDGSDRQVPAPETRPANKPSRAQLIVFALGLAAISLFMYLSFIVKTAVRGP